MNPPIKSYVDTDSDRCDKCDARLEPNGYCWVCDTNLSQDKPDTNLRHDEEKTKT